MITGILNSRTKTVTFSAFLLAVSALVSGVLGLFRDNLLANLLPKAQGDIYFAAFRIPDFIYGILITGGVVAAFLPVFSASLKKSKEEGQGLVNNTLTVFLIALSVISAFLAVFTPQLVRLIVPGFDEAQKALTVTLTRIMFLSPILLGASAIFSGILQYFHLFFAFALAPVLYNLGIIFGILVFRPAFGLPGLAAGVILGALLHLIIQIPPAVKAGIRPRFSFNIKHQGLKRIFKLMLPRTFSTGVYHINLIVITAIASTLVAGSIRVFNLSNNLQGVPLGLIGISFATAAFPVLSRHFAEDKKEDFSKSFFSVFSQVLFLTLPLSVLFFLLRAQVVRLIYGTQIIGQGFFGWWETRLTAASLGIFSCSLFAACLIPLLSRAFFAAHDTKTPVKIAVAATALNVFLSFLFVKLLGFSNIFQRGTVAVLKLKDMADISIVGLPLAFALSTVLQFFLLDFFLKKKIKILDFKKIYPSLAKTLFATLLMAVFTYLTLQVFSLFLNTDTVFGLLLQTIAAAFIGAVAFIFFSYILKSQEMRGIFSSIKTQFKKP